MSSLWASLSATWQDSLIALALVLPGLIIGALTIRGFAPWALVRALLWRFRWPNVMFVLLIAASVGMGIGLIAQERGLRKGTAAAADKFDMIVAAPGSEMTLMLASVYLQPSDVPLLKGQIYNEIANHDRVTIAAPLAFGDSFDGAPIIGTIADFARYLSDNRIEGRMWQDTFEAIAGAYVPLDIGDSFVPSHGFGDTAEDDAHGDQITVVGRMAPTGSPWDRAIMVPVESVWAVHGLANGHAPDAPVQLGPPYDAAYFPGTPAIVVKADELWATYSLRSEFTRDAETMAFFPGTVLAELYAVMGDVRQAMSLMTLVTQVLVATSVLVGMFILTRLFRRQMSLLRALGAPGRFVLSVVWSYAAMLLVSGAVLGLGVGLGAAHALSRIVTARTDILVVPQIGWTEVHLLLGFLSVTLLLSLLPALAVLRRPIVDGLRA
ncbi:ABC transporter permease [Marinovum sp. 2_MG-2023]|uniref:FtsX-like permease family protein n=1 Tax=unclassified Marinovum TaxID=2647166 RepID=UPI0026E1DA3C|nr:MULTISPECIES: ABC transporter permease [unclassified Marinovum]MDO6728623.1 ABC transporter permease [Marinovum sp. 2_MG-2023]MDO6777961.1 ABC transporter permease [Marinovum sp. 1_MG-2023]